MKIKTNEEILNHLTEFVSDIQSSLSLECVILFGSRARKDFMPNSDIDLIFIGNFKQKFIKQSKYIYEKYVISFGLDAFCYTPQEFDIMFHEGVVSILDSIDEGICLLGNKFFETYKKKLIYLKGKGLRKDPPVWILPKSVTIE